MKALGMFWRHPDLSYVLDIQQAVVHKLRIENQSKKNI